MFARQVGYQLNCLPKPELPYFLLKGFYTFYCSILYVWVFCLCSQITCVHCLPLPREGRKSPESRATASCEPLDGC